MDISIIIPAYNEASGIHFTIDRLRPVIEKLRKAFYQVEVVFVNDGSKDNTEMLLQKACESEPYMRLVSYKDNKGLGGAIRTGFAHAKGRIIVTTDFDGTYDFSTIPNIIDKFEMSRCDIVTASPYHQDGTVEGVPRYRLMFSYGASTLYRWLISGEIATWTALFRVYRRRVVDNVAFESDDFLAGTELLVRSIQRGYTVEEFPTVLGVRGFGQSSIRIVKVTKAHLRFQRTILIEQVRASISDFRFKLSSAIANVVPGRA